MMNLTDNEKRTIKAVLHELLCKPYSELNTFLGSLTIEEMQKIYGKLKFEGFCEKRGIRYEDMTEQDYIDAYEEEMADDYRSDYDDEY